MKKLTKTNKITITTSVLLGGILISTPSYGFNIGNFLGSILDDIKGELELIQTLALKEIENTWSGIKADAQEAIQDSIGDMGAPDPIKSGKELKTRLGNKYSLPVAQEKAQDLERELTRASISAVLGEEGQQETANKIQKTTETAQEAQNLAEQAQDMDATQNVLKVMAGQNAQIVSLLAQQRTDSLQSRHDAAQTNLMLTQIAENLASQRKREDIQKVGLIAGNHELLGTLRLDPTYQQ
ncbi:hypothetical protein PN456_17255 [Nodularia spumigena CS-586/05]|uniref:hypothetical protein n=1 Tax=Nodularia spumigena TaxID=70799 RepID=UPI00232FE1CD|nr:hypothetical protein [Nodularia spumigena]MDB9344578.1 hypothetical protein [Nodularia spumigena CS-588/06]MDB9370672.1 hypothetical protein [Nodularia spumigena CS-586/05]